MTLEARTKQHEGLKLRPYRDTKGKWTIYWGHLMRPGEVYLYTRADAEKYLAADIAMAKADAVNLFPGLDSFSPSRREVLIELCFNMGRTRIRQVFPRFVHNVNRRDWVGAEAELRFADGKSKLSLWYLDVKETRAEEMLAMLLDD